MKASLEGLSLISKVDVTRTEYGTNNGLVWTVTFTADDMLGDLTPLTPTEVNLAGAAASIIPYTETHGNAVGGTFSLRVCEFSRLLPGNVTSRQGMKTLVTSEDLRAHVSAGDPIRLSSSAGGGDSGSAANGWSDNAGATVGRGEILTVAASAVSGSCSGDIATVVKMSPWCFLKRAKTPQGLEESRRASNTCMPVSYSL